MCLQMNFLACTTVIVDKGSACLKVSENIPKRSIPHLLNDQRGMIVDSSSARATWGSKHAVNTLNISS